VLDNAAIDFTRTFYSYLFKGTPICEAFKQAKGAVEFMHKKTEANLFLLLLNENFYSGEALDKTNIRHECYSLPVSAPGLWKCHSEHNRIK
jgi:hypothetical protein